MRGNGAERAGATLPDTAGPAAGRAAEGDHSEAVGSGFPPTASRGFTRPGECRFIGPGDPPNDDLMFGKYLVERGLLREADLIDALDRQAGMRVTLGRLAYQLGMMTLDQVMKVLEAQRKNPLRFGALAVELGFLTSEQLETLLETQRDSRVPLGQILASLGYLSPEKLDQELRNYLAEQRS